LSILSLLPELIFVPAPSGTRKQKRFENLLLDKRVFLAKICQKKFTFHFSISTNHFFSSTTNLKRIKLPISLSNFMSNLTMALYPK